MNLRPYIAFYNGKKCELNASSSYAAQQAAAVLMKVPAKKQYMISVCLSDIAIDTASL